MQRELRKFRRIDHQLLLNAELRSRDILTLATSTELIKSKLTELQEKMDLVPAAFDRLERRRDPKSAAQFDWLARRAMQQEQALAKFLEEQVRSSTANIDKTISAVDRLLRESEQNANQRRIELESEQLKLHVEQKATLLSTLDKISSTEDKFDALREELLRSFSQLEEMIPNSTSGETSEIPESIQAAVADHTDLLRRIHHSQVAFGTKKSLIAEASALTALYGSKQELPSLGEWSMTPRNMLHVRDEIQRGKHKTILEIGSGASTAFIAEWTKSSIDTEVISLEHDPEYYAETNAILTKYGHSRAQVHLAPLGKVKVEDKEYTWYTGLPDLGTIDLLIVDGPPGGKNPHARYPALPMLAQHLKIGSRIIIDDIDRTGERSLIEEWTSRSWCGLSLSLVESTKQLGVLEVTASDRDRLSGGL